MIISSKENLSCKPILKINGLEITWPLAVTLLGIKIDDKLNFDEHVSNFCVKASRQLNAICRLQYVSHMNQKESKH